MYVILVYDVGEKRVAKAMKTCRKYLQWIQNSVFEGETTDSKLERLKLELYKIMDISVDSVLIFRFRTKVELVKEVIGVEKNSTNNIF